MLKKLLNSTFYINLSTSKNYTSSFKIRSRLADFFKHVHPDQLTQAPTKIKQENLRSLTNFNSYIDNINQSRPIEAKILKFYIAEKNNSKSKKFFSFTVQLPQVSPQDANMPEQKAKKLLDNIVDVLNKKFLQSKTFRKGSKKGQEDEIQKIQGFKVNDKETQEERFNRMGSKIKPFSKKSHINQQEAQALKSALNNKYMQAQKQTLSTKLRKSISFADTGSNKPLMWSRLTTNQSGIYKDYKKIMDSLIDPRLIYFDQTLSISQIDQFKKRILPGATNLQSYNSSKIITEVCAKMQSFQPPICFYVSNKYSSTQIPGFITIPYNFKAVQLAKYYQKQIDTVLQEQQKYQQYYDYYMDLKAQLQTQNNFVIDETNFKNNNDIRQRVLMLKRLQRYKYDKSNGKCIGIVAFEKEMFEIFKNKYEIKKQSNQTVVFYNGKIILRVDFLDEQMQKFMNQINQISQSKVNNAF